MKSTFGLISCTTCILVLGLVPVIKTKTRDVIFVLDRSGSIYQQDFDDAVDFVYNVVVWLNVGNLSKELQISILTFASETVEEFDLNDYTSKGDLLEAIGQIKNKSTGGGTNTNEALEFVYNTSFLSSHGSRKNKPKAVVVLTDGQSSNPEETRTQAEKLHNAGYEVYSIGVGLSTSASELAAIASDPDSYYVNTVDTFAHLCNVIPVLVPKLDADAISSDECAYTNRTIANTTSTSKSPRTTGPESNETTGIESPDNTPLIVGVVTSVAVVSSIIGISVAVAKSVALSSGTASSTTLAAVKVFGPAKIGPAKAKFTTKFKPSGIPAGLTVVSQPPINTIKSV